LTGQVISIDRSRLEVTVAHDPIENYMTAMVMPFKVRQPSDLGTLKPGDFVRGSLVIHATYGYLDSLERTGSGELPGSQPTVSASSVEFLIEGDTVPDARFVDEMNSIRHLRDDPGKAVVLTFVYTRCPFPTFCPLMDRHFQSLQRTIRDTPTLANRVRLLSVTLDLEFDTPNVLRAHATRLQADPRVWSFVRPEDRVAAELSTRFGVTSTRDSNDAGVIVHDLATVVVRPDGVVARIFRGNEWTPRDITILLASILPRV
jgi:protein SCO1/2